MELSNLGQAFNELVNECHSASVKSGWWTDLNTGQRIDPEKNNCVPAKLCLIHSEISEAMEGHRKNLYDSHLKSRKMIEVELADAIIRICDLGGALNLDLGGAIIEKMTYNASRADHKVENRKSSGGKTY